MRRTRSMNISLTLRFAFAETTERRWSGKITTEQGMHTLEEADIVFLCESLSINGLDNAFVNQIGLVADQHDGDLSHVSGVTVLR